MALPFGAHVPFSTHSNPSPLSFGFGFGVPQHHMPPPAAPEPQSESSQVATPRRQSTPNRTSTKRRFDLEEIEGDDAAMESAGRSPSPFTGSMSGDRPMRRLGGASKKMRMITTALKGADGKDEEDSVDVGSLLASLPPSSLLPLLTSLISERPELKPVILSLIPRPTLDTAIQAVNEGAKKLKEAYPYATNTYGSAASSSNAMRDSYVRTRLRQPVRDFTKLLLSYMSYFTSTPPLPSTTNPAPTSSQPIVALHPTETFAFLHTVTLNLLRYPSLTLAEFARPAENVVFPRLNLEWNTWVSKIDEDVNRWGKMYRSEDVQAWERGLDELVAAEENVGPVDGAGANLISMRAIRDRWIERVGWLIGRRAGSMGMEMA